MRRFGIRWFYIFLAVALCGSGAAYFVLNLEPKLFVMVLGGAVVCATILFLTLRYGLGPSPDMPSGWTDPVIDKKKARKVMGLPEKSPGAEAPFTADSSPTDAYSVDRPSPNPAELATEFLQMGRLLLKSGRFEEAKNAFINAARHDPGNSKAYNYLGIACGRLNEFEDSVEAYNKAIALDYDYASAHFNLASVYDQMNDRENALIQWQRYLDVGRVVGEREDMLERARSRLETLKEGADRKRKARYPSMPGSKKEPPE